MAKRGVLVVAALLAATGPARASIWLGNNAVRPVLRVDARGDALVSWMQAGQQHVLFVPPQGQLYHGGSLAGPDISRRTYRATVAGPNIGWTLAPDAQAVVSG